MKLKKVLLIGLPVFAIGVGAALIKPTSDAEPTFEYTMASITRGDVTENVSATGTLNPINTVQVGSQVSGTIVRLHASFNDRVEQNKVIAEIDPAVFQAKLAEATAAVQSAEAVLEKSAVSVRDAERELERQRKLFRKKLVAERALDQARFAHETALVEHKVKLAALEQAKATRQKEQVNLAYTKIYAPIDGIVISRDVDVGQTVAASLQAPTLFTIANDLTQMQVEAEVDESYIGQVDEGQTATFTVFAYPGRTFEGRVAQVRLQPQVESGVVKYNSIIHVDNSDLALKPGMTASVSIQVANHTDSLQVPASAMRFVPDWTEERLSELRAALKRNERYVWVIDKGNLTPVKVLPGITSERRVEVTGEGLREGMKVALPEKKKTERTKRFGLSLF